ncbi:MAG: hypothetical protein AABW53_02360 [Nanoarchaeota archaeon]
MTKVFVFDTLAEAKKNLGQYLQQNKLVNLGIGDECAARLQVYKNSADFYRRHKSPDEEITPEEARMVFSQVGKGQIWTYMLKLYFQEPIGYYAFYGYFNDWNVYSHSGDCGSGDSIASLVSIVQKEVPAKNTPILDVKTIPLFYTVREIFSYSRKEIQSLKNIENYKLMSAVEQEHFDRRLHEYRERSFTDAEIREFVTEHARFLN